MSSLTIKEWICANKPDHREEFPAVYEFDPGPKIMILGLFTGSNVIGRIVP